MTDMEVICGLSEETHGKIDTKLYHRPELKF